MTVRETADETTVALVRQAAYGLISLGFQYPDSQLVETLCEAQRWSAWPEWLGDLDGDAAKRLADLRGLLEPIAVAGGHAHEDRCAGLQDAFNGLFGHAVRGKCPPYELEYGRAEIIQQASGLADIAGFYTAFGMEVSQNAFDRADHVAVESEFMSVLCAKEAHAIESGEPERVEICVKAQRDFLRDHLGLWLPGFAHRVDKADPRGFYGALARFASAFVRSECRRFRIALGPGTIELRPADPVLDTTMSCEVSSARSNKEVVQLEIDHGESE